MTTGAFDFSDEKTRRTVGQALRTTYELDAPMPDHLQQLMNELQQRLNARTGDAERADDPAQASGETGRD